ncbi:MAG: CvpA family protein [Sedimentibacter sp.]|uniref:CvpA family protein n=1 Tax=Sedimentibacter sp. TaxID=1960295 RepID=UPI0029815789|nr:CvpA family protein [Sedimentibacter sp.]MDW5300440.1 CvpA family protein [Sedimentibacter sp.]
MNFIDIIILIFAGYSCFQGYRRGFIKTIFDTLGVVVAFFASKEFYYIVENFLLNNTKLFVRVHDFFESRVSESLLDIFQNPMNLPAGLQNIVSNIINSGDAAQTDTLSVFVDNISLILIRSISFIITFLIIYVVLVLLANFINVLFKLPILNITNRMFGAITGSLKCIILLYLIFALSSPLISFMQESELVKIVLNSESSKIFYDNNILLNYLSYKGFYDN